VSQRDLSRPVVVSSNCLIISWLRRQDAAPDNVVRKPVEPGRTQNALSRDTGRVARLTGDGRRRCSVGCGGPIVRPTAGTERCGVRPVRLLVRTHAPLLLLSI